MNQKKLALISVSDKTNIIDFAKKLVSINTTLLSTGGTTELLRQNNIPVKNISEYTEFPEILDGRVKSLHPKIFGGILSRGEQDQSVLAKYEIEKIDFVITNLYPFVEVTKQNNCELNTAIENIDIGGVSLIRAAAKNYQYTTIITDPLDYDIAFNHLNNNTNTETFRFDMAAKAFRLIATYDLAISDYFSQPKNKLFPNFYLAQYTKKEDLRYGENPHQKAAFYVDNSERDNQTISSASQLSGKELSYNNIVDADTALECVKQFSEPACVIVKHANPCGVAAGKTVLDAYQRAFSADPTSAFGGIIAFNTGLDSQAAQAILENQFVELVIAPNIDDNTLKLFSKKLNVRLLTHNIDHYISQDNFQHDYKKVNGGLLIQESDTLNLDIKNFKCVTTRAPSEIEYQDLLFAWRVVKFAKSNAIVIAKNQVTLGIGSGQTSRIDSTKIAIKKAAEKLQNSPSAAMASDAFFPFKDGIEYAIANGISAIIQPGGSIRDQEVIDTANEANVAMIFTGTRHFRH